MKGYRTIGLTAALFAAIGACANDAVTWQPPFTADESRAYGDGGTLGIGLRDRVGAELIVCISQDAFESPIPHSTLFVDAWHPDYASARLPQNGSEVELVRSGLRSAAREAYSDSEIDAVLTEGKWPERDRVDGDASAALSGLRRLRRRSELTTYNAKATPPGWWADYERERQARLAEELREKELDQRLASFFPRPARVALDGAAGWTELSCGIDDWDLEERLLWELRAKIVAASFDDPSKLAESSCRALSLLGGHWYASYARDEVVILALRSVSVPDFVAAAQRLKEQSDAVPGVARALFAIGFAEKLSDEDWVSLVPHYAERVLAEFDMRYPQAITDALKKRQLPESLAALERIRTAKRTDSPGTNLQGKGSARSPSE